MKVLIVKTSSMGDVIHTLPALTDASNARPDIQFDWLVEEGFAEIPAWHPAVHNVIPCAVRRWRKNPFKTILSSEWKLFRSKLLSESYDLVIDAQGLIKSAFLARLTKSPIHGLDSSSAREALASFFYQNKHNIPTDQHAVERIRQLFSTALNYPLPSKLGHGGLSQQSFLSIPEQPYVLFLHGTTRADKHWPDQHWIKLAKLITDTGLQIKIPWYNNTEKQRAETIALNNSLIQVLPKSNLTQLAAALLNAKLFIAVDTGLGHLGAALNVRGISLYGPTDPAKIGAYGINQTHLKTDSMAEILPASVHNKLLQIT